MAEMIELVDILVLKLDILRLTDHHNRPDKNNNNQYEWFVFFGLKQKYKSKFCIVILFSRIFIGSNVIDAGARLSDSQYWFIKIRFLNDDRYNNKYVIIIHVVILSSSYLWN